MTSHGVFLLTEDDSLIKMREEEYDSEAILQKLLASYPNLIPGDQINQDQPRR